MLHFNGRLCELTDVEKISLETDCLVQYINKGISMASFYYARCLALGRGVQKDEEEAKKYYSLVSTFSCFLFHYLYFQLPAILLP